MKRGTTERGERRSIPAEVIPQPLAGRSVRPGRGAHACRRASTQPDREPKTERRGHLTRGPTPQSPACLIHRQGLTLRPEVGRSPCVPSFEVPSAGYLDHRYIVEGRRLCALHVLADQPRDVALMVTERTVSETRCAYDEIRRCAEHAEPTLDDRSARANHPPQGSSRPSRSSLPRIGKFAESRGFSATASPLVVEPLRRSVWRPLSGGVSRAVRAVGRSTRARCQRP